MEIFTVNHARFWLDTASPFQHQAAYSGCYDYDLIKKCAGMLPDGGVFLDIGANIGLWGISLWKELELLGRSVRGFCFEPMPATFAGLSKNIELNAAQNSLIAYQAGLSDKSGELTLFMEPGGGTNNSISERTLTANDLAGIQANAWTQERCPVWTLDEWAQHVQPNRIDFIKIDVEGQEPFVLQGGLGVLKQFRPVIFAEFNPYWLSQTPYTMFDVESMLAPVGYLVLCEVAGQWQRLNKDNVGKYPEIPAYLLLPMEKQATVVDQRST